MALGSWTIDESSCEVIKSKFNGVTMTWLTLTEIASIWLCILYEEERWKRTKLYLLDWCQAWYLECAAFITALISIVNCNLALVSMSICHEVT